MVYIGKYYTEPPLKQPIFISFQTGTSCKWTRDSKDFILEKFDDIINFPCHIYNSALQFCPHSSWLYQCYSARFLQNIKVIAGPAEWRPYNRTVRCICNALAYKDNIIAASDEHEMVILDATTGSQAATFSEHSNNITSLAFSMDGTLLVSGSLDKTVKLWDVQTGGVIKSFACDSEVAFVSISADNTMIVSTSADNTRIVPTSAGNTMIFEGTQWATIYLWNIETGEYHRHRSSHRLDHNSIVRFPPESPQLLQSASGNGHTQWFWMINGKTIGPPAINDRIAFSPDGTQFVSCYGNDVIVKKADSEEVLANFHKSGAGFSKCCFSLDGKFIACTSFNIVYLLATTGSNSLHLVKSLIGHKELITSIAFSSLHTLISADEEGIKFWEISYLLSDPVTLGTESILPTVAPVRAVSMGLKDGLAFSIDSEGIVKTWNTVTGHCVKTLKTQAKGIQKGDMQLVSDKLVIVGVVGTFGDVIHIWDIEEGKSPLVNRVGGCVTDVRIAGDGSRVFHLSWVKGDYFLQAQSLWTGEPMGKVALGNEDVWVFDPLYLDGSKVVVLSNYSQAWDFGAQGATPVKLSKITSDRLHSELVAQFDDGVFEVRIEAQGNENVFPLPDRYKHPSALQWDGQYVIAGYQSGEVLILDLDNVSSWIL